MTMRMCKLCEANPVASDGKCIACLKDAAGPPPQQRAGNRRPKTPRGVRTSTPSWVRSQQYPKRTAAIEVAHPAADRQPTRGVSMRRRRPMNVQVFEDIDGTRVEIDQREVHAARVERHDDGKVIVIEHGEEALTRLGIGARPLVETWLGRTLDLRLSDAEVWAHPKAEEIYAFISGADYGTWNRVARQMTREQWTEGVRQVLEGIEMHRCESCERKPLQ